MASEFQIDLGSAGNHVVVAARGMETLRAAAGSDDWGSGVVKLQASLADAVGWHDLHTWTSANGWTGSDPIDARAIELVRVVVSVAAAGKSARVAITLAPGAG